MAGSFWCSCSYATTTAERAQARSAEQDWDHLQRVRDGVTGAEARLTRLFDPGDGVVDDVLTWAALTALHAIRRN